MSKRINEEECVIDKEEDTNETEIFNTKDFSVLPLDYFGTKIYRIRRLPVKSKT